MSDDRLDKIESRLTALERFQTTVITLGTAAGAVIAFLAEKLRKVLLG